MIYERIPIFFIRAAEVIIPRKTTAEENKEAPCKEAA